MKNINRLSSFLAAALLVLAGCGQDQSPVASSGSVTLQEKGGVAYLTFSPEAARRVGKIATIPAEGATTASLIGLTGGQLSVKDDNGNGPKDDVRVDFNVGSGALSAPATITMTVYGNTLEELIVAFQPSGLVFLINAELDIRMGRDLVSTPVSQILAWHEHGDGSVEAATITEAYESGNTVRVKVSVPGFSRYSMGGGD